MDNYEAVWKVLEELTTVLKANGVSLSGSTMKKLRSSRATINIYNADPTYENTVELIEGYLGDLEAELMSLAEKEIGESFAEEWLVKIAEAKQKKLREVEPARGFVPGVPRSDYWIRIQIGETIAGEELRQMAAKRELSTRDEGAEYVVVHGERGKIKQLIREITEKMRKRKEST